MRTLDTQGAGTSTLAARLVADVRLLWRIAMMAYGYWTVGGRVRRDLSAAEARGDTYWLDHDADAGGERAG